MIKNNLFIWVCDYSENSGEGKLARLFVNNLNKKKNLISILIKKKQLNKNIFLRFLEYIIVGKNILKMKKFVILIIYLFGIF